MSFSHPKLLSTVQYICKSLKCYECFSLQLLSLSPVSSTVAALHQVRLISPRGFTDAWDS